jgi:hypothetical protein
MIPWPTSVVGGLAAWLENPTVALNEMLPSSTVLAELNESPDPGIPYVMLAGNTSLIPAAIASPGAAKASALARLLSRLTSPDLLHKVANPFFLDQENDVAVSVASMENVAPGRKFPLDVHPVACDHLSYFRDPSGLQVLVEALQPRDMAINVPIPLESRPRSGSNWPRPSNEPEVDEEGNVRAVAPDENGV